MNSGIKVFAPASVANVSVGFDILGFALDKPGDEIIVREGTQRGLHITKITGDKGKLPRQIEKNTAGFAALQLLKHLGEQDRPLEMEIHKKMPFNSGLGSSAASAVAGVMAINEFLGKPLTKREILPYAVEGEQVADGAFHADNVAPSLFGGMILIRDTRSFDYIRIPVPPGLHICVVHPHINVPTKESRAVLRNNVSLSKHIAQSANLGGFISSLYTTDLNLMKRSLQDLIVEPQRAHLIPHFYNMREYAMESGALGFGISGAGPSVYLIAPNSLVAEQAGEKISQLLKKQQIGHDVIISKINQEGAFRF